MSIVGVVYYVWYPCSVMVNFCGCGLLYGYPCSVEDSDGQFLWVWSCQLWVWFTIWVSM